MTIRELANGTMLVPHEDGEASWLLGHLFDTKATGEHTRGTYSIVEVTVAPAPLPGAPPHIHNAEDEAVYVLEGAIDLQVGQETITGGPGTFAFITRDTLHAFNNPGSTPARFLFIISPPGFEEFFSATGVPASDRVLPEPPEGPPGPADLDALIAMGKKYNMDFVLSEDD